MSPPPGPRLPALVLTALVARDPVGYLQGCRRRFGPVFQMRYLGGITETYVTTPELAAEVYATDKGVGRAGAARADFLEALVGPDSLLCLDDEPWKRHRRLLSPAFHGRAVADYRDEIAQIAAREIERWPSGEPFPLRPRMQAITLEVILRLVFGIRDAHRLDRLRALLPRLVEVGGSAVLFLLPRTVRDRMMRSRLLRRLPFVPTTRFVRLRRQIDEILLDEIARRRAQPYADATDVLSRLLATADDAAPLTDDELRDELITLLEAGHETTATGLAWAFERLVRNPDVLARLRADIDSGRREYLEAVVKETLRSRPVVYEAPRQLAAAARLGGYDVPKGSYIAPMIALVHRDPGAFPDPDAFRPQRFLGNAADGNGEGNAAAQRGWMPFGGGRRYCLGAQLALLEMEVVIREVLRRVELSAPDPADETPTLQHVTLTPRHAAQVVARPRTGPLPPPVDTAQLLNGSPPYDRRPADTPTATPAATPAAQTEAAGAGATSLPGARAQPRDPVRQQDP